MSTPSQHVGHGNVRKNCPVCGSEYVGGPRSLSCQECRPIVDSARKSLAYGKLPHGKDETLAKAREMFAAANLKTHPCRYCGKPAVGEYCRECMAEGMHRVHQVTGRTNGWDKKKSSSSAPQDSQTPDGWRGRRCAGYVPATHRDFLRAAEN